MYREISGLFRNRAVQHLDRRVLRVSIGGLLESENFTNQIRHIRRSLRRCEKPHISPTIVES